MLASHVRFRSFPDTIWYLEKRQKTLGCKTIEEVEY